jgi:triosephosphate isomerase
VSDCGCFGDAVHLTNWETFWKNIVLTILTVIVFTGRKHITSHYKSSTEWIISIAVIIVFVLFSLGNLRYLPVIDFLPYKTGLKIAEQMVLPEGAKPDKYQTTFIYQKNGVQKEFTLENYPANDTSWVFVDQKTILIKKGYQPPVHDFIITRTDGVDITNHLLADEGYSLLMISKKLNEAKAEYITKGFELGQYLNEHGISFYVLTATSSDELQKYSNGLNFCTVDETTLKTMVRANPGYMLLKNGEIKGKWSWATLPSKEWYIKIAADNSYESTYTAKSLFPVISLVAALLLILLILVLNIKY